MQFSLIQYSHHHGQSQSVRPKYLSYQLTNLAEMEYVSVEIYYATKELYTNLQRYKLKLVHSYLTGIDYTT